MLLPQPCSQQRCGLPFHRIISCRTIRSQTKVGRDHRLPADLWGLTIPTPRSHTIHGSGGPPRSCMCSCMDLPAVSAAGYLRPRFSGCLVEPPGELLPGRLYHPPLYLPILYAYGVLDSSGGLQGAFCVAKTRRRQPRSSEDHSEQHEDPHPGHNREQ